MKRYLFHLLTIVTLATLAGCASQVQEESLPSSEKLLAQPPPNWHRVYQINSDQTRLSDFVPQGETDLAWNTKLSFESFVTDEEDIDPIQLLLYEVEQDQQKCNFVQHFNLFSGLENNYETSVRLFMCGTNEYVEKGEIKLVKAIRGKHHFYTVRLIRRIPSFEVHEPEFETGEIAEWASYLKSIKLCDDNLEDHPCP